ncbi:MAG: DUF2318 domain-containing protein [Acidobacteriota bacterium]|nr:MAG: DUF2318 domain-containing protein [Acidobacteriota bacterium]
MRTAFSSLLVSWLLLQGCGPELPEYQIVEATGDVVRIARSTVADGEVHFFTFKHGDKNVNFLVRTDGTGLLRAHLDACFSCYRYKRGYVVEGSDVVCIACRLSYRIDDDEWDYIGACAPIPLRSAVDGNSFIVSTAHLERAARYF